MIFKAKLEIATSCFRKFKMNDFFALLFVIAFTSLEILYRYHKDSFSMASLFYTALCLGVLFMFLRFIYGGTLLINKTINKIEIDTTQIIFQTFDSSFLFNVIKKQPIDINVPRNVVQFVLSTKKYGFDKKYTGGMYLLVYAGDEYLIAENFFDNFSELKASLEN
jgi:hypothetical protein